MERLVASVLTSCALGCFAAVCNAQSSYKEEKLLVKGGPSRIEAISRSTRVEGPNPDRYSIRNLFDNDNTTPWVTKYDKKSAYSDDGLFKFVFETPVYLRSITIRNGCQRTASLFHANQRVKTLGIEKVVIGGRSFSLEASVTLKDTPNPQEISLREGWTSSINLFKTKELIFNVEDIYEGTKYQDLCISEMTVNYSSGIEYSPSVPWKQLQELIDKNSKKRGNGWDWANLVQNNHRLFNDLLYYTLTGNKEAYLRFRTYSPEGTGQSAGMANIYRNAVKESLAVNPR